MKMTPSGLNDYFKMRAAIEKCHCCHGIGNVVFGHYGIQCRSAMATMAIANYFASLSPYILSLLVRYWCVIGVLLVCYYNKLTWYWRDTRNIIRVIRVTYWPELIYLP